MKKPKQKDGNIKMENPEELYRLTGNWLFHSGDGSENAPADDSKDWRSWIVPDGQETLKLDATESHPSWLRIDFELSSAYEGKNLAFLIPPNGNYSIYLNGEKHHVLRDGNIIDHLVDLCEQKQKELLNKKV